MIPESLQIPVGSGGEQAGERTKPRGAGLIKGSLKGSSGVSAALFGLPEGGGYAFAIPKRPNFP